MYYHSIVGGKEIMHNIFVPYFEQNCLKLIGFSAATGHIHLFTKTYNSSFSKSFKKIPDF